MDRLSIEQLESLSDSELLTRFEDWVGLASQPSYKSDYAGALGNKLAVLNSRVFDDHLLNWTQNKTDHSLESLCEFCRGYWNHGGPLDQRVVRSLYDFVSPKKIDDKERYLSVLLALAEAFRRGMQPDGLRQLLQRYESTCRRGQPGFSAILAESLASSPLGKV